MHLEKISIVIPVLNEAHKLQKTLELRNIATHIEIIVVDGGSQDQTVELAQTAGVQVLKSNPGRAQQMNLGAKTATGEILLFLHADTHLPAKFDDLIRNALAQPHTIAGAFNLKIDLPMWSLRLVEWGVNLRSRYLQMPYGDQALFLYTRTFNEMGGFPNLPIMEDFELIRQLRRRSTIAIIPTPVITSGRRWQKLGVVRTTLINQCIIVAYLLGISPQQIAHWYQTGCKPQPRQKKQR